MSALKKNTPKHLLAKVRWGEPFADMYPKEVEPFITTTDCLEILVPTPNKKQTGLDLALQLSRHWKPWLPASMLDHSSQQACHPVAKDGQRLC